MSKPDVRAIVDLHIDFVVQNVSAKTMQCHYTDGWGPSSSDPEGHEGLQDCLLDRYQLCAERGDDPTNNQQWFDFSTCLFRNQKETDTTTDHMKKFDATVRYCSDVTGQDYKKLRACAESDHGAQLLLESHNIEKKLNPFVDKTGHHHPDWIIINGKDYGKDTSANWLQLVCDAFTGTKPTSCVSALVV
jgi:hypothetical protein